MRTKKQLWFKTDANFYSTEEKVRNSSKARNIISHKGRLTFQVVSLPIARFQVMRSGKVSLSFPLNKKPELYIQNLKPLLVKEDGSTITKFEKHKEIPKPEEEKAPLQEKVEATITDLRFILMRNPTPEEIAETVGIIPEKARELAYKSAPKTKWKEISEEDKKKADLKIKDIYKIASLLDYFGQSITLTRPTRHLVGKIWKDIIERAKYALDEENKKVPKIKVTEETNEKIEFEFIWPHGSPFGSYPEYYYKKRNQLSGDIWLAENTKKALNHLTKTLKEIAEEK